MTSDLMSWVIWAIALVCQNASFTLVSRARNSGSVQYHAMAAVLSNGIYFLVLAVAVDKLNAARTAHSFALFAGTALFYTAFTVIGGVAMHSFLLRFVETGKRRVGSG